MKLDIFTEVQKARAAWGDDHEQDVIEETLEQARLADELGYECWWQVEHHGATEFSYSSAPELLLTAISQRTSRLRLGHSGVLAPFKVNHPIRVAERAATLDRLSHGRAEVGFARSGGLEWETFGVDPESSLEQVRQCMQMVKGMWTESPFSWQSELFEIPERNIVPKPLQRPHPSMWQTTSSPGSFRMAGNLGVGVLATTLMQPLEVMASLLDEYRDGLKDCEPVGDFVNDQTAVFTFVHCAETTQAAIESGAANAALWYVNSAPTVFKVDPEIFYDSIRGEVLEGAASRITVTEDTAAAPPSDEELDDPNPVVRLLRHAAAGREVSPEEAYGTLDPLDSVIIGDVETCRRKMQRYRDIGVDRLMCFMQIGDLGHESIMRSQRLTAGELLPAMAD